MKEIKHKLKKKKNREKRKKKKKYDNGDIYNRYYKYRLKNGYGIMKYSNGEEYDGNWENEKKMENEL